MDLEQIKKDIADLKAQQVRSLVIQERILELMEQSVGAITSPSIEAEIRSLVMQYGDPLVAFDEQQKRRKHLNRKK